MQGVGWLAVCVLIALNAKAVNEMVFWNFPGVRMPNGARTENV